MLFVAAVIVFPREKWQAWWVLTGAVMAIATVHLVTISSYRFAIPTHPAIFAFGAGLLARVVNGAITGIVSTWVRSAVATGLVATFLVMQRGTWPISYDLRAAGLDGIEASDNPVLNGGLRYAGIKAGPRPVVILTDQYLAKGQFTLSVEMRADPRGIAATVPIARVRMFTLEEQPVCDSVFTARELSAPGLTRVQLQCMMRTDGVASALIETTALAPLEIGRIAFRWSD